MSFRKMSFGKHGNGSDRGPLRKVVGLRDVLFHGVMVERELLECGHLVRVRKDLVGRTNAARRRCGQCKPWDSPSGQKGDG
jgi:hypothetical protein